MVDNAKKLIDKWIERDKKAGNNIKGRCFVRMGNGEYHFYTIESIDRAGNITLKMISTEGLDVHTIYSNTDEIVHQLETTSREEIYGIICGYCKNRELSLYRVTENFINGDKNAKQNKNYVGRLLYFGNSIRVIDSVNSLNGECYATVIAVCNPRTGLFTPYNGGTLAFPKGVIDNILSQG